MRTFTIFTLLLTVAGCQKPTRETGEDSGQEPPVEVIEDLAPVGQVNPNVSLVVDVTWTSEAPGPSWVEFGEGGYDRSTPVVDDGSLEHHVELLGLPAETPILWRAATEYDGERHQGSGTTTTGPLPADLPTFTLTVDEPALQSEETWFVGSRGNGQGIFFALDRKGRITWYLTADAFLLENGCLADLSFTGNGNEILGMVGPTGVDHPESRIFSTTWTGEPGPSAIDTLTTLAHHTVRMLPDGTVAWLEMDIREWVDTATSTAWQVVGDAIVEQPPGGEPEVRFSTWNTLQPYIHDRWGTGPNGYGDFTHANHLYYDPSSDAWLVSLGNLDRVSNVDRRKRLETWAYGSGTSFSFTESSASFRFQHSAELTADGRLLMSSFDWGVQHIFAVEYDIDVEARTLDQTWSHGEDQALEGIAGGQALELANGNVLLNTGTGGILREVTPDGQVVWEVQAALDRYFVKVLPVKDLYAPGS